MATIFLRSDNKKDWEKALRKLSIENDRLKRKLIAVKFKNKKLKEPKQSALRKTAWGYFSKYRRLIDARVSGNIIVCQCISCGKWYDYKTMQAGHFYHGKLDFDSRNIWPQCVHCNKWMHGNLSQYRKNLTERHNQEWMEKLDFDAHQPAAPMRETYLRVIAEYRPKVLALIGMFEKKLEGEKTNEEKQTSI